MQLISKPASFPPFLPDLRMKRIDPPVMSCANLTWTAVTRRTTCVGLSNVHETWDNGEPMVALTWAAISEGWREFLIHMSKTRNSTKFDSVHNRSETHFFDSRTRVRLTEASKKVVHNSLKPTLHESRWYLICILFRYYCKCLDSCCGRGKCAKSRS